jgi:membrane fusion protein, copper/silver efflux system
MKTTFIILLSFILIVARTSEQSKEASAEHEHTAAEQYTCPMHPTVISDKPGTCPVCGMDLVKVDKSTPSSNDLMLSDSQIKLANITTQKVNRKPFGQTIAITGRLAVDEQASEAISSRVAGRIEKLFVKETGTSVRQGQPLYTLYSEGLLTLQQEYLLAKEQYETLGKTEKRYRSFLDASERKLLLYGLTKNQIGQLSKSSLQPRITFIAPASGIVTEIGVSEGQYISEGGLLYKIEDIGKLWVEAELYPSETSLVKVGDRVIVNITGENNSTVDAKVTFLSPEYNANSQVVIMRASLDNSDFKYKPGQQAQVYLTHSSREGIAIPVDAVIRDGKGTHVYVQAGRNTFRPQMVKTGIESFDQVEITEGIKEGDTVAISGAYLLYSEIILKKGVDPMAGHNHQENQNK